MGRLSSILRANQATFDLVRRNKSGRQLQAQLDRRIYLVCTMQSNEQGKLQLKHELLEY